MYKVQLRPRHPFDPVTRWWIPKARRPRGRGVGVAVAPVRVFNAKMSVALPRYSCAHFRLILFLPTFFHFYRLLNYYKRSKI
jgi:hypothetical protein